MHSHTLRTRCCTSVLLVAMITIFSLGAQAQRAINDADRVTLQGNTHPLARAENDRGSASPSMPMERMVLSLAVRPDAQAQLQQFLADQQNPSSPNFHKWITPTEFGLRFGPTDQDIADAANWLRKFGFTIDEIGTGRMWINFSGDVQKVERAFQTNIRTYEVNGKLHHANASDPSIPRALTGLVNGVVSLNDFPKHPQSNVTQLPPDFTAANGAHFMAPADFSIIYNVNPLYASAPAIDGTGQTVAIVGRTDINLTDVQFFRSFFGLPANDPVFIHNGVAPGDLGGGEETEADLDVEWSGAVAKNATIKFVISRSTATTDGVDLSAQFIVNNNTASIMSTSFGLCEASLGAAGNSFWNNLYSQAAAQGITAFVSSGDSGAAGCDPSGNAVGTGTGINGLASTPNNVAVGGTEFSEGTGVFWNAANNPADQSSVISYIPEVAWNESGAVAGGSNLLSTGGGASIVYAKPPYQAGPGVPADGVRDIPDVSLSAAGHDGYLIFQGHTTGTTGLAAVGGTSASSPSFAGLMALVLQKVGSPQGNANPVFYRMGTTQAGGGTAIFHDTTAGNNSVPGVTGFSAGAGYDQATGWGSVDANALVNNWAANTAPDFGLTVTPASQSVNQGATATYTANIAALGGFSNSVTFTVSGLPAGATPTFAPNSVTGSGSSTLSIATTASTPAGNYPLTVSATDGVLTHTASITLVITTPDFTLTAAPALQSIISGGSASYTATVAALNGYSGTVSFSVSGLPAGATPVFTPGSVVGSGTSNLTITTTAGTTPNGNFPLVITASDGVLTHTANVTLAIADFSISADPASQTVLQGGSTSYTVTLTTGPSFTGTVNFSVSGLPGGATPTFSPTSLTTSGTSALNITTVATTTPGTYPLTISASDGVSVRTASVSLTINPAGDFSLTISPSSQSVQQGQNIGYGVTVSALNGFTSVVNLSISGLPAGATASFNPPSINTSGLSSLSIVTAATTPGGTYTITVTGTSGGVSHSANATLTVLAPDFSLSASPASQEIIVGQNTSFTITQGAVNNYTGTVNYSVSGLPSGTTFTFSPASLTVSGTTTLSITTSASTPPGTYPLTITGADTLTSHSITVTLIVDPVPAADFSISAPSAITVKRNSSGSETVTITAINGFTGTVNLTISGVPSLVTATFSPTSVTGGGTSKLTFTVDHRATQGIYHMTVTGTSGPLVHSTPVTLTVN